MPRTTSEALDLEFEIEEFCYKHLCHYILDVSKIRFGDQNDDIKTLSMEYAMQIMIDFIKTNYEQNGDKLYRRKRK